MASLTKIGFRSLLINKSIPYFTSRENFIRTIISKATIPQDRKSVKPKPWPYNEKRFNFFTYLYDRTSKRFDENSMVIVVEGPVAAGKSKVAKKLAEELDMQYFPEANLDMLYINSYGFDMRKLNPQLPEGCRIFDVMDFLKEPKHPQNAKFQVEQYMVKFSQYVDALAHLFSTGQGVILDRSCFSDFVFVEAMYSQGHISKQVYKKYYEIRDNTIIELLKPHLVIYLDVPVPKILENINKRAISYEKNSPALTPQYLQAMENAYKQNYLKMASKHAELLVYDWSDEGDVEIVIEDMEEIDFTKFAEDDPKMEDWSFPLEDDYAVERYKYVERKDKIMNYFNIPCYDTPELTMSAEDSIIFEKVVESSPGNKFEQGYNAEAGDTGLLFKTKMPRRNTLPLIERRITK